MLAPALLTCHLKPIEGRPSSRTNYAHSPNDTLLKLVFFSTFEPLDLPKDSPMENAWVQKLDEPSPTPILLKLWLPATGSTLTCWVSPAVPPVSGSQGDTFHPLQVLSAPECLTPTLQHRFVQRYIK